MDPRWCVMSDIGRRDHMEDRSTAFNFGPHRFFGVYDGHGGKEISEFLHRRLHTIILSHFPKSVETASDLTLEESLRQGFKQANQELRAENNRHGRFQYQGSTAVVVLVLADGRAAVASVGDSEAMLVRDDAPVVLHKIHKPTHPDELARIRGNGEFVANRRLNGRLAMSRAFGDFGYRSTTERPEVRVFAWRMGDALVMGSDGLWDGVNFKTASKLVYDGGCAKLLQTALRRSSDNITVLCVWLDQTGQASEMDDIFTSAVVTLVVVGMTVLLWKNHFTRYVGMCVGLTLFALKRNEGPFAASQK